MKQFSVLLIFLLLNIGLIRAQEKDSLFHDAGIYTSFQWSAEKPLVVTPQAWIYIKKFYLEARYNYENINTVSLYFGRSFSFEKNASVEITPMLGGVVGETNGLSPGFNFRLDYRLFSTSTQCQYTINLKDIKNSFFWDWTNFCFNFSEHFGIGGAVQIFIPQSGENDFSAGPMIRLGYNKLAAEIFVYNIWHHQSTYAIAVEYAFD